MESDIKRQHSFAFDLHPDPTIYLGDIITLYMNMEYIQWLITSLSI